MDPAQLSTLDSSLSLSIPQAVEDAASIPADDTLDSGEEEYDRMDTFDDNDSALGGSLIGYDRQTIASYITDYRYENGRRYHAYRDGEYWGANDESAIEIEDLTHHMWMLTLGGKLHLAPLENPQNVLDVGTGTGLWAIEIADTYPSAQVVGTDLSPLQPNSVPPNVTFEIDDLNNWAFPLNSFDFIHVRELFGCVSDWDEFFAQAFAHTKPGGYVEIMEHSVEPKADDDTVNDESFLTTWGKTIVEMGEKYGKSFSIWRESKACVERAGFVDVVERRFKWPLNEWPSPHIMPQDNYGGKTWKQLQNLGRWNCLRLYNGVEGYALRLMTTTGGWTFEQSQEFMQRLQESLLDTEIHAFLDVSVVYGRKPGGSQQSIDPTTT